MKKPKNLFSEYKTCMYCSIRQPVSTEYCVNNWCKWHMYIILTNIKCVGFLNYVIVFYNYNYYYFCFCLFVNERRLLITNNSVIWKFINLDIFLNNHTVWTNEVPLYQQPWYVLSYLWDGAHKRSLVANWREQPMKCWERVSFLIICSSMVECLLMVRWVTGWIHWAISHSR